MKIGSIQSLLPFQKTFSGQKPAGQPVELRTRSFTMTLPACWQVRGREDGGRGSCGREDRLLVANYVLQGKDNATYRASLNSCRSLLHDTMLEAANDDQYEADSGFEVIHHAPGIVVERHRATRRQDGAFLAQYSILSGDCMIFMLYEGPSDMAAQMSELEQAIQSIVWH